MSALTEQSIQCPYCGEHISVFVDPGEAGDQYIEDCQVCCRPIEFFVYESADGAVSVNVSTDYE